MRKNTFSLAQMVENMVYSRVRTLCSVTHRLQTLPFSLSPVPMWAIGAIVVVVLALVGCMGFCIYKKCFNKGKKPKKARERKVGRGRRKKDKDGEDGGDEKKVRMSLVFLKYSCF